MIKIAWFGKHFGEEPPLTGDESQGAGGIFFVGCNLRCCFCQNYQISQKQEYLKTDNNNTYSVEELAQIMIDLQKDNCKCIDLVTPTIWYKEIKKALILAKNNGLKISVVWNSNGYENADLLREMNGLVDVYLPDFKYSNNDIALKYSGIKNYKETAIEAIREMYNQVGVFDVYSDNIKGVIIRHLILPNNIDNSFGVLDEIVKIDKNIPVSLMSQYNPIYNASNFDEINRKITQEEFESVLNYQLDIGIENGWHQELDSSDCFVPNFMKENPFK